MLQYSIVQYHEYVFLFGQEISCHCFPDANASMPTRELTLALASELHVPFYERAIW